VTRSGPERRRERPARRPERRRAPGDRFRTRACCTDLWLPEEHLAWFALDCVEEMDLTPHFHTTSGPSGTHQCRRRRLCSCRRAL